MAAYIDRETRAGAVAREITDHAEIARWLISRGLIEYPPLFTPAPEVGEIGEYVVLTVDRAGKWQMEVMSREALDERYEMPPNPEDEPATV